MRFKLLVLFFLVIATFSYSEFDIHIYETDENPFQKAKTAVEAEKSGGMTRDINVILHEGTYQIENTIVFGPNDGGDDNYSVNYKAAAGETPIISGGWEIPSNSWSDDGNNIWSINLSAISGAELSFRELYMNGKKLKRATHSSPNYQEYYPIEQVIDQPGTGLKFESLPLGLKGDGTEEIVIYHYWSINRAIIENVDYDKNTINARTFIMGHADPQYNHTLAGDYVKFENVSDFLDEEDEWYMDHSTGILKYYSSSIANKEFVIPRNGMKQFIVTKGSNLNPVKNLTFSDIKFNYSTWNFAGITNTGFPQFQGDYFFVNNSGEFFTIPPAIEITYATKNKITNCELSHIGNTAIALGEGCVDNTIDNCIISDVGGSGIIIGMPEILENSTRHQLRLPPQSAWYSADKTPVGNTVSNCDISNCANQYYGSVGIWIENSKDISILNNRIYDLSYTGISSGFTFSKDIIRMSNCNIVGNEIFNVMKRLSDGAGIYTLGNHDGSLIKNNYIHDISKNDYAKGAPIAGIFFDQGTHLIELEDNAIENVPVIYNYNRTAARKVGSIVFKDELEYLNTPYFNLLLSE